MAIIMLLLFFILIIIGISFYAYRMAFYAPKRVDEELYQLPMGPQYEKEHSNIITSINKMLEQPYEEVIITSFDGTKLFARYYHIEDNAPLQIQFHGYKSSAILDFCGGSYLARKMKHNALVVDQRSHGKSEGHIITFGIRERRDCLCWIQYARTRFGEHVPIILFGLSMGAATVLMASDLALPDNVKGIIADCPYSSPKEIIQKVCTDQKLPAKLTYPFVRLGALLFGHFNLEESSAVNAVAHTDIPILLIHGLEDRFVPWEMSDSIHKSCASAATLKTISGAGHGLCYLISPADYEKATMGFVADILSD